MTVQTKADLEKQVKSLQRKVAKLERELAAERTKADGTLPASPFVEPHVTPLPQNAFPWEHGK